MRGALAGPGCVRVEAHPGLGKPTGNQASRVAAEGQGGAVSPQGQEAGTARGYRCARTGTKRSSSHHPLVKCRRKQGPSLCSPRRPAGGAIRLCHRAKARDSASHPDPHSLRGHTASQGQEVAPCPRRTRTCPQWAHGEEDAVPTAPTGVSGPDDQQPVHGSSRTRLGLCCHLPLDLICCDTNPSSRGDLAIPPRIGLRRDLRQSSSPDAAAPPPPRCRVTILAVSSSARVPAHGVARTRGNKTRPRRAESKDFADRPRRRNASSRRGGSHPDRQSPALRPRSRQRRRRPRFVSSQPPRCLAGKLSSPPPRSWTEGRAAGELGRMSALGCFVFTGTI